MTVAMRRSVFYSAGTQSSLRQTEDAMQQDTGPAPKGEAEIAAAARRLLDDVTAEPVPDRILDLARNLDQALAEQRKASVAKRR